MHARQTSAVISACILGVMPAQLTLLCQSGRGHFPFAIAQGLSHFYLLPSLAISRWPLRAYQTTISFLDVLMSQFVRDMNGDNNLAYRCLFLRHDACGQERMKVKSSGAGNLRSDSAHSCGLTWNVMRAC